MIDLNQTGTLKSVLYSLLKAVLYGTLIYLVVLTIASILLWLTPLPESVAVFLSMSALCLASLVCGCFGGRYFKRRGFLYGAIYAFILLAVILLIYSFIFPEMNLTLKGSLKYLLCLVFGSVGGMIAVNR